MPKSHGTNESNLRTLLLAAARQILSEPNTPLELRGVARRAGKSRTAPYLVFGKESEGGGLSALKLAIAAEGTHELADQLWRIAQTGRSDVEDIDPLSACVAVATATLSYAEAHPRLFRLMYGPDLQPASLPDPSPPELTQLMQAREKVVRALSRVIEAGQEQGLLRSGEPVGDTGSQPLDRAHNRYSVVLWSSLVGLALLREDALIEETHGRISIEEGASLITESLFAVDPIHVARALKTFIRSRGHDRTSHVGSSTPVMTTETAGESMTAMLRRYSGLRRASYARSEFATVNILWVDDQPDLFRNEVATLRHLGATVEVEECTSSLLDRLERDGPWDLILSDIARGSEPDAGVRALPAIHAAAPNTPVIFFIADLDPSRGTPKGAAGITNRTDDLLHLILDVVEGRIG